MSITPNIDRERAQAMVRIREADQAVKESRATLHGAVTRGRQVGLTQEEIAKAMGVTRQAVAQRFPETRRTP